MGSDQSTKDSWDKWHIAANSLAILLVPALLAYFGAQINASIKDKEISQKYVELAIGLLRVDPDKQPPALRNWAINIVNANSPVPLEAAVRDELKQRPLRPVKAFLTARVKAATTASAPELSVKGTPSVLTDGKGNVITDGDGNAIITGGEPLTFGGDNLTFGGKNLTFGSKPEKR